MDDLGLEWEAVLEMELPEDDEYFQATVKVEVDPSEPRPIVLVVRIPETGISDSTMLDASQARLIASALLLAAHKVDGKATSSSRSKWGRT